MRRFFIALPIVGMLWYGAGLALDINKAEAGKTVLVKCAYPTPKVPYPHYKRTSVRCVNPGFWVRLPRRTAIAIGTAPIRYSANTRTCMDLAPKVTKRVGKRSATSSWVPRQGCIKQVIL